MAHSLDNISIAVLFETVVYCIEMLFLGPHVYCKVILVKVLSHVCCYCGTYRPAGIQVAVHGVKHITWRPSDPEMFYVSSE